MSRSTISALVLLAASLAVMLALVRSRWGLFFRAIRENEDAAAAAGVKVMRFRVLAFAIASAFAGLAGGFFGHYVGILTPDIGSVDQMGLVVAMAVIGGAESIVAADDRRAGTGVPGRGAAQLRPVAAGVVRRAAAADHAVSRATACSRWRGRRRAGWNRCGGCAESFPLRLREGGRGRGRPCQQSSARPLLLILSRKRRGRIRRSRRALTRTPSTQGRGHDRADRGARPDQALRRHRCGERSRSRGAAGRAGRADRPERLRQDHHDQHADRPSGACRRPDLRARPPRRRPGRRAPSPRCASAAPSRSPSCSAA